MHRFASLFGEVLLYQHQRIVTMTKGSSSSSSSSSSSLGSRCVPWLGEGLSMLSPNYPVLCFPLPYRVAPVLSRSSLHRLAGLPCRLFLSYGLQLVTREVHRSSLRRLICPAQDHFIFLTVLIISIYRKGTSHQTTYPWK